MNSSIFIILLLNVLNLETRNQQATWPIDIYIPEYGYFKLNNDVKMQDTIKIVHSENIFFKFVFFSPKGKSYCEVYKKNKLYEKGYYENSLDTLKVYAIGRSADGTRVTKIQIHKYFQPLKNGQWTILENGKTTRKKFLLGIEEKTM